MTPAAGALIHLLDELRDVLTLMPAGVYRARPAARVSGSIGEHVRHCLDHVGTVARSGERDDWSYDHRLLGTTLEIDPAAALNEIERLTALLDRLPAAALPRAVDVAVLVDAAGAPVVARSTIAREVAYVVHHTIHHCASIALLLEWQGHHVPAGFGLAPSTVRARRHAS